MKAEMLRSEIAEIKANLESVEARRANLPAGPARTQFESDLAEMKEELAAREKELSGVMAGGGGAESAAITREMIEDDIADIEANIASCEERLRTAADGARSLYESERSELAAELAARRKDLSELG